MSIADHSHTHHLQHRSGETRKVAVVGAVVNLILAIVKIIVGVIAHSEALVADGVHSLSDLMSDALVFFAAGHSVHGPDEEHPYGHGRFETVATMGLGAILILVAVGIVWDAVERLFSPENLLQPTELALYAAAFSILANEGLYRYTMVVGKKIKSDMLIANAWHHRSDAFSSIVVLIGVAGTMAGLTYLDAVAAVIVGFMIAKIGWELGWDAMQELVDAALDEDQVAQIRSVILDVGGVRDIHMLRTRRLGGVASADVHVLVQPHLSVSEGHMIALRVEQDLKTQIAQMEDVTVHIDPEDDEEAPPCGDLPLRTEVLKRLKTLWKGVDGLRFEDGLTLHYLSGRIDVDVLVDSSALNAGDPMALRNLQTRLQQSLDSLEEFRRVRVYLAPL